MGSYVQRRYRVTAEWHDQLCAELLAPGLLGIESTGGDEIRAYYRRGGEPQPDLGPEWPQRGVRLVEQREIVEQDWLESYRALARPAPLGERFWADPSEPAAGRRVAAPEGRVLVRLPARRAFGTGSHESTRLAAAWLEDLAPRIQGASVLDLGSGSGVLSFICAHLGARCVLGVERDLTAAFLGGVNRRLNASEVSLIAGSLEAVVREPVFDTIVVNILFVHLLPLLRDLARRLRGAGCLVVSGALSTEQAAAETAFDRAGLRVKGRTHEGEWVAWSLEVAGR